MSNVVYLELITRFGSMANSEPDKMKTDSDKLVKEDPVDHRHAWADAMYLVSLYRFQFSTELVQNLEIKCWTLVLLVIRGKVSLHQVSVSGEKFSRNSSLVLALLFPFEMFK